MKRVGVVGGGQLARMMIPAAVNLGIDIRVFAESENSSATLAARVVGNYRSQQEVSAFSSDLDVLTFDHEHVPTDVLIAVRDQGVVVSPSPEALTLTHNKIVMRHKLADIGVPQPRWSVAGESRSRDESLSAVGGFPCVAKKPIGGYDGKGVRVITSWDQIGDWLDDGDVLLEEKVPFVRELGLLSARSESGEWVPWLPVETRQLDGVCAEVIAPAPGLSDQDVAESDFLARSIADSIGVVGVLAVEVFQNDDGRLLVNELAMRPHNSGHIFTELSVTSQFEQHLRAVADLPLGSPAFTANAAVMVNLFGEIPEDSKREAWRAVPEAKIHDYGKEPRDGRKVGHISVVGSDADKVYARAIEARSFLSPR